MSPYGVTTPQWIDAKERINNYFGQMRYVPTQPLTSEAVVTPNLGIFAAQNTWGAMHPKPQQVYQTTELTFNSIKNVILASSNTMEGAEIDLLVGTVIN